MKSDTGTTFNRRYFEHAHSAGVIIYKGILGEGDLTLVEVIPEGAESQEALPAKDLTVKDFTQISSAVMATLEDVSKELGKPISSANMIRVFHVLEALARGEV